ncbi:hypothetical protein LAUMK136_05169 [Mycobacterium attenuatum]|uniref:Uncharacterized protein n=1 Tax=Mycobacterium attenuatum TaxID=2341086 RepID=A0A498QFP1_9MYCO|nr:hypothetical protein LAUMK136_05169 [Mycobacterium attenuatum]
MPQEVPVRARVQTMNFSAPRGGLIVVVSAGHSGGGTDGLNRRSAGYPQSDLVGRAPSLTRHLSERKPIPPIQADERSRGWAPRTIGATAGSAD